MPRENDVYADTDARMMRDPEFRAAVRVIKDIALRHGFTPGELKQLAFRAALEIEMERPAASFLHPASHL